jgi:hypothetical protein
MKVEEKEVDEFRESARAWVRCPLYKFMLPYT